MEALPWFWIWVVVAAVFFVGEMLTTSFFLFALYSFSADVLT